MSCNTAVWRQRWLGAFPRSRVLRLLAVEQLESRLAMDSAALPDLEIPLIPEADQFGVQIESIQAYGDGEDARVAFGIYDTGASVVTFSAADQLLFDLLGSPIPVKVPGGAVADAIGGTLQGDVSEPAVIVADGLHAVRIDSNFNIEIDLSQAARAAGVQAFIGDPEGSPYLPTIVGTPIHVPSAAQPSGVAAWIQMSAYEVDFGELFPEFPEFKDIVLYLPDLRFTAPGTRLQPASDGSTTDPVRLPIALYGDDNHLFPGDLITTVPNPVHTHVKVEENGSQVTEKTFLFDTGAQLSVVSTSVAASLGLNLQNPESVIDVYGAGGSTQIPGFVVEALELSRDDNADGVIDGVLRFTDVPIYVLDVAPGLDGILGMNLFNPAWEMLYDPYDPAGPSLSVTFLTERQDVPIDDTEQSAMDFLRALLGGATGALARQGAPGFQFDGGPGWQNTGAPHDVNGDGKVTARDALLVVNDLNRYGARELPDPPLRRTASPFYPDVTGDGKETARDVLLIVNYLNRKGEAQGESQPGGGAAVALVSAGLVPAGGWQSPSDDRINAAVLPATLSTPQAHAPAGETVQVAGRGGGPAAEQPCSLDVPRTRHLAQGSFWGRYRRAGSLAEEDRFLELEETLALIAGEGSSDLVRQQG